MKKQTGFTLIEIMIALTIGLIVVAATISIYVTTVKGSSDIIKSARLNHDLDSTLALMVNDIRRAGYWGGAMVGSDSRNNPFTQAATDLQIPSSSCVLYSYDADASGANTLTDFTDDVNANEYYGFRLSGGNIQMRSSNIACDANGWNTLNVSDGNERINVTNLTFTQSFKCLRKRVGVTDQSYSTTCAAAAAAGNLVTDDRVIETREITITLAGRVNNDQAVTKNLTDRVKIRNDRTFTQL
ncbi:MAG: prepilin-type N-terminal cleavage/methylation domain-containing protein [Methylococcales bacterium]|nr:prepilin-type N-terminal cleavage/methylation domain-containing protein [Methylococcales bacterium]